MTSYGYAIVKTDTSELIAELEKSKVIRTQSDDLKNRAAFITDVFGASGWKIFDSQLSGYDRCMCESITRFNAVLVDIVRHQREIAMQYFVRG